MGLFDRRSKKKDGGSGNLAEYAGMRVEVMDEEDALLFVARADVTWRGELELRPITVPRVAPGTRQISATIRGYQDSVKKAVHMAVELSAHGDGSWGVEDLEILGKDNDRAFFRQEIAVIGEVIPIRQQGFDSSPCRVLNVSAGGVCIFADAEYRRGEKLVLRANLLESVEMPPFTIAVRRITKRKNGYEYGCEFTELTPAMEDFIAKAILEMQLKRMRRE